MVEEARDVLIALSDLEILGTEFQPTLVQGLSRCDSPSHCGGASHPSGSIFALASYENRVYQVGNVEGFFVAKFYRPGLWSTEAILEEHAFALELGCLLRRDGAMDGGRRL